MARSPASLKTASKPYMDNGQPQSATPVGGYPVRAAALSSWCVFDSNNIEIYLQR